METTNIYVLALEDGKYYVGRSAEPAQRFLQHVEGAGSEWTRRFAPLRVVECVQGDAFDEDKLTKRYMQRYGIENVRGGSYCLPDLERTDLVTLRKELANAEDRCFQCGEAGHFVAQCPRQLCTRCGRNTHTAERCVAVRHFTGVLLRGPATRRPSSFSGDYDSSSDYDESDYSY